MSARDSSPIVTVEGWELGLMEVSGFDSHFDFLACLSAWHGNFDVASQLDRKYPAVHETESACLGC